LGLHCFELGVPNTLSIDVPARMRTTDGGRA
jgi:hypothetical protein